MSIQNKILIALIILMMGASSVFFYLIYRDSKNIDSGTSLNIEKKEEIQKTEIATNKEDEIPEEEMRRALGIEQEQTSQIKTIKGRLKGVDLDAITVLISEENKSLDLKILNIEKIPLIKQIQQQENGIFLNEEIEFNDLPLGKNVEVKYNENNNQLLMITVLM